MTFYTVITDGPNSVHCSHVQTPASEVNNRSRGETATFDVFIPEQKTLTVNNSHTVKAGTTELYYNVIVESNATLSVKGTLLINGQLDVKQNGTVNSSGGTVNVASGGEFSSLLKYDRHAGSYNVVATLDSTQRYNELLPLNANINSLVVGLEPDSSLQNDDIAGKWGLISNITDGRTQATTNNVITIEIDILADMTEYSDVSNVQSNLET